MRPFTIWFDNVLFWCGLVRITHYTRLMEEHQRLQQLHLLAVAPLDQPLHVVH